VVEEAPSPVVDSELRNRMGAAAIDVARSCNYEGVGTVEFLLDKDKNFYFLEMNTRLQVEHPVTEMITGLDLVEEQIKIARGEALSFTQDEVKILGHAIEIRVYAEDPENDFLPDLGRIVHYKQPTGLGVRVDDGYRQGMDIPLAYDSMIAKLIVHAEDRDKAIENTIKAINDYEISGFSTTLGFCRFAIDHPEFRNGNFTINFVGEHYKAEILREEVAADVTQAAYALFKQGRKMQEPNAIPTTRTEWGLQR